MLATTHLEVVGVDGVVVEDCDTTVLSPLDEVGVSSSSESDSEPESSSVPPCLAKTLVKSASGRGAKARRLVIFYKHDINLS